MKLKVEYIPIEDIKPYEKNAKIHTDEQIEQIKKFVDNLQVTKNFSKVTLVETNAIKGELIGFKIVLYGKKLLFQICISVDGKT